MNRMDPMIPLSNLSSVQGGNLDNLYVKDGKILKGTEAHRGRSQQLADVIDATAQAIRALKNDPVMMVPKGVITKTGQKIHEYFDGVKRLKSSAAVAMFIDSHGIDEGEASKLQQAIQNLDAACALYEGPRRSKL